MRDPERLFSGNGITDFERELLDAGKNEAMPEPLRQRMEAALGLTGGAVAGVPSQAGSAGTTGNVTAVARVATLAKTMKVVWLSAGVVALGFAGGILGSRFFERGAPGPVSARASIQVPAALEPATNVRGQAAPAMATVAQRAGAGTSRSASLSGSGTASPPAPAAVTAPMPVAPVAAGHGTPGTKEARSLVARVRAVTVTHESRPVHAAAVSAPHTPPAARPEPALSSGDLRVEIDLIDAARGTLRTGSAARALEILGRYSARFPHGALAPEGVALRVEALMRLGRTAEARTVARRFVAANPTSPLVERMNRLAGVAPTP
jgi:hypothetical protein